MSYAVYFPCMLMLVDYLLCLFCLRICNIIVHWMLFIFNLTGLTLVLLDNSDISLFAGGDIKQISSLNQLTDVIEVLLCISNHKFQTHYSMLHIIKLNQDNQLVCSLKILTIKPCLLYPRQARPCFSEIVLIVFK